MGWIVIVMIVLCSSEPFVKRKTPFNVCCIHIKSIIFYWIVCGAFFACDSMGASVIGYCYFKMMSLSMMFYYIARDWMKSTENKGKQRISKIWAANSRVEHTSMSSDTTCQTTECRETTLDALKTVPNESHYHCGLSTANLNRTQYITAITKSSTLTSEEETGTARKERSGTLKTAAGFTSLSTSVWSSSDFEGLATYPESQDLFQNAEVISAVHEDLSVFLSYMIKSPRIPCEHIQMYSFLANISPK
ncbi:unnamed protein product [Gongylonema pulchrum]|uniref:G_PROTEIN_RECEP_F1_2 domain-containing protein n=1 Tax=Gongylonema pulchrum TaxID=637853 RepID=A0A183CWM4_9BILA|nr:unnamed protein product [Gongylonema pulchrum]